MPLVFSINAAAQACTSSVSPRILSKAIRSPGATSNRRNSRFKPAITIEYVCRSVILSCSPDQICSVLLPKVDTIPYSLMGTELKILTICAAQEQIDHNREQDAQDDRTQQRDDTSETWNFDFDGSRQVL